MQRFTEIIDIFFSPTLLPCHFLFSTFSFGLCLTFCLSFCNHLLANLPQNVVILNACSSTTLTIFSLSFSVILLAGEADPCNDDNIEHSEMVSFTPKPIIQCSAFRYQPLSCLSLSLQMQKLKYHFFYSPLPSSPLGKEGHYHIFLISSLRKPEM